MGFEVSKSEYERFLKWKNEVDAKEETVKVTLIEDNEDGYWDYGNPNDFDEGEVCKIVSFSRNLSSMGVDSDFVKQLCDRKDSEFESWKDVTAAIEEEYGKCFFKLVDVYSHSGTCVHFTDLEHPTKTDRWDSSLSAVVFIPVVECIKWGVYGIKDEKDLTPEILKDEFLNYENLVNAYLSGEGCFFAHEYEIAKSTFKEAYENDCLVEFLERYGEEKNSVGFPYYLNDDEEDNMREINEQFDSELILYDGHCDGPVLICKDENQNVEDFLGIAPEEKHTKSRSR